MEIKYFNCKEKVYVSDKNVEEYHPVDFLLRTDLIPSIWCPGCGIGIVVNILVQAIKSCLPRSDKRSGTEAADRKVNIEPNNLCVVSGVGCTGKVADYLKFNSSVSQRTDGFNTVDNDNAIDSAILLKQKNPQLKVVVFLNDADFITYGADSLIEVEKKKQNSS